MKNRIMKNKMNRSTMKDQGRQAGAVLVTSLFILVILTLLAISAMTTSNFELIMATNIQAQTVALANAETAVSEGEIEILTEYQGGMFNPDNASPVDPTTTDSDDEGIYAYNEATGFTDNFELMDGDPSTTFNWSGSGSGSGYATGPSGNKYVIEFLGERKTTGAGGSLGVGAGQQDETKYYYRLTGQGTSGRGAERFVQTLFVTL
jgi:Tfp pilus assembly protein PilX